uniref:Prolyl 3,4-dihydroxylase TPA1/OFD1 N-terminal domain-containing protein n=1 Tax=Alexandrium monilatum TaxID=311494 RepID=A0A7S4SRL5_9DINO
MVGSCASSTHWHLAWRSRCMGSSGRWDKWQRLLHQSKGVQYSRHALMCGSGGVEPSCPPMLGAFHEVLAGDLGFWSQFSDSDLVAWSVERPGTASVHATWYRSGDFGSPHNDLETGQRALAFVLYLTKDWNASFGGSFFHLQASPEEYEPGFNVLHLFRPSVWLPHMISTVLHEGDDRRRLAVSGWFHAANRTMQIPFDA